MNPDNFLYLSIILFAIGLIGIISRKNLFVIYMSIELMLSSVNLVLATFSRVHSEHDGAVIALLMIAVIAAEAAIFLALIVYLYKNTKTIDSEAFTQLSHKRGAK
ncbi:MAG: NADH-quinone oxidoreductase subunit NuoK [Helicobacteraceae bacterium]|nr:NADH-quinone oxidoreductase subunit NuoK [Helicobacteraceae bacterium]